MRGISAIGKLIALGVLAIFFFGGMAGVIYLSLQGSVIQVPEITGKNFADSERELASLGLKIKKRADRVSGDAPNTVIEQLPKPGETVKTGQMIYVVISKGGGEGDIPPPSLKKSTDEDDSDKIEEMISEKPKKPKANTNSNRKKAETTRDVEGSNSNSNSDSSDGNSNKSEGGTTNNTSEKPNRNTQTVPTKPGTPSNSSRPGTDPRPKTPNRPQR
ncbi:MAG: PASTA domain-containing protein [Pyrinomonadaceae bacterium]|nr:PASTA domain-containing protein [Pyrinomonadaceae bacterium]MBP6211996.1 PASTA domain-containing protein [Pyrinomonadaceae bacterium]